MPGYMQCIKNTETKFALTLVQIGFMHNKYLPAHRSSKYYLKKYFTRDIFILFIDTLEIFQHPFHIDYFYYIIYCNSVTQLYDERRNLRLFIHIEKQPLFTV